MEEILYFWDLFCPVEALEKFWVFFGLCSRFLLCGETYISDQPYATIAPPSPFLRSCLTNLHLQPDQWIWTQFNSPSKLIPVPTWHNLMITISIVNDILMTGTIFQNAADKQADVLIFQMSIPTIVIPNRKILVKNKLRLFILKWFSKPKQRFPSHQSEKEDRFATDRVVFCSWKRVQTKHGFLVSVQNRYIGPPKNETNT